MPALQRPRGIHDGSYKRLNGQYALKSPVGVNTLVGAMSPQRFTPISIAARPCMYAHGAHGAIRAKVCMPYGVPTQLSPNCVDFESNS